MADLALSTYRQPLMVLQKHQCNIHVLKFSLILASEFLRGKGWKGARLMSVRFDK
jgi:hypothetical protein